MNLNQKNIPDLNTVLNAVKSEVMKTINCVNVGTIESFDATEQTATIRLSIKQILEEQEDGTKILKEHPLLLQCPVIILSGSSAHITFPVAQGDLCLVFFNDRDIDNWFFEGGVKTPNTNRMHDLSDAFALVGIRNIQTAIEDYLSNGVRIKFNDTCKIDLLQNAINSLATLWTHTGNLTVTGDVSDSNATTPTMAQMRSAYNSHTHGGGPTPSPQM